MIISTIEKLYGIASQNVFGAALNRERNNKTGCSTQQPDAKILDSTFCPKH